MVQMFALFAQVSHNIKRICIDFESSLTFKSVIQDGVH